MREAVRKALGGDEGWIVGGAVRDELLGRPIVDLDVACPRPDRVARAFARIWGGAPFALSERWGAWRVVTPDGTTVDFTPLRDGIEDDLATRDFTINAIAEPARGGDLVDPFGGRSDLDARVLRAVSPTVFADDPLRLLRAVRLEDELAFRIDPDTERLAREHAQLVDRPAGERIVAELERLSADGFRRLDALGLLVPLGGRVDERLDRAPDARTRLVAVFGERLERLPVSREQLRYARTLLGARPPADGSPRAIHRFRRETEPWAVEALRFVGADEHVDAVNQARAEEPAEPLLRGDELDLPSGPEIGQILAEIEEERAAGAIATREEALELARRRAAEIRRDS